ncbi:DUF3138 family protein [Ramlibacter monticola]|uniref:DUF3138 family protein n=1 Tax=Ramlibacter monticola TaxID=1926872 RepID=A0A936Z1L9_9BURK|nr:DUF3138 family protein [Ramlibacter monticola]MBL0393234.1 DUF3138 family protein [Ramlibacter monticola]
MSPKENIAILLAALPFAASAQTNSELKQQIEALKAQVQELRSMMAPQQPAAATAVDPAEFSKVRVKVEALEDNQEAMGFKGMRISGYIDPTYIYNKNMGKGSVLFLNNNYNPAADINDFTQNNFYYGNSYFGSVTVRFDKEMEDGLRTMVALRPRRTVADAYGLGSIVEEAGIWVPFHGLAWKAWAGQAISWNGYEYVQSYLKKNITSNLLLDYAGPGFITGAGIEYQEGKWWIKTALGNLNTTHDDPGSANHGAHWRVDYSKGEFDGWGASGMHGKVFDQRYNYLELDGYFIRGPWTLQGQIEASTWKNSGFNGGNTGHTGISGLAAYKFTPRFEGIVRADWLDNHKNGGGTPSTVFGTSNCPADLGADPTGATPAAVCGDQRGGFGPGAVFDPATGVFALGDPSAGAKRSALTLGLNYQYHLNGVLKFELRRDWSNVNSFRQHSSGNFTKSNTTFGVQTVVSF